MGNALAAQMFASLLAVTGALAAPASPVPTATERPLREIGHVRATTTFCRAALERATQGVNAVLENDRKLAVVEDTLRHIDLDSSVLAKFRGSQEINRQYVALRATAVEGSGTMKRFKLESANAPSDAQRAALTTFAAALDGALNRQRKLADAIGRLVVYIDNHPPIDKDAKERLQFDAIRDQNRYYGSHPLEGPLSTVPDTLSDIAKQGADELEARAQPLVNDEADAAARIDAAFANC